MSWKYSSSTSSPSYGSRNNSVSYREPSSQSKFGLANSKLISSSGWSTSLSGGDSHGYHRNFTSESAKQSPAWSKTRPTENPISVQRLKERYNLDGEGVGNVRSGRLTDSKEESSTNRKPAKYYGRSLTCYNADDVGTDANSNYSKFRRKSPAPEPSEANHFPSRFGTNSTRSIDPPRSLQLSGCENSKLLRKYSGESSPGRNEGKTGSDEEFVTVVTRGTSPTPTVSIVYLRSKRNDYGIEKRVPRQQTKPEMIHRGIQTERESGYYSKYATYGDGNIRTKPWSSYVDKYSTGNSYARSRSNYSFEGKRDSGLGTVDCRRSTSREESEDPSTPESPSRSHPGKPPLIKETDKKLYVRKSPPTSFRLPLKPENCGKPETMKSPNSPNLSSSPIQCKLTTLESPKTVGKVTGSESPKVTIDRCPDIIQSIADVSSASESSEEESSSDDETDGKESTSGQITIKKSITNFLQNIPSQTRMNSLHLPNGSSHKVTSPRGIQSGEKSPRWSTDGSSNQSPELQQAGNKSNNFLSPPGGRHFGNVKSRCEEEDPKSECLTREDTAAKPAVEFNVASTDSRHFMKFPVQAEETSEIPGRRYPGGDFLRERSFKEINQKIQNGLRSPHEEMGEMSGLISKAKAELTKSKPDVRKSSSRELSPLVTDPKSEIDLYWKELANSSTRPLLLCDLDFTDLNSDDETDILGGLKMNGEVPPPPPMLILPASPSKPSNVPVPPGAVTIHQPSLRNFRSPAPPPSQPVKNKKTVKLFWKEVKEEPAMMRSRASRGGGGGGLIWDELLMVKVDTQKLEHLFESKAKDLISKKQQDQGKNKEIIVLDPKRSNAINIGMTKLPPPRAIKTAILKMDSTVVNKEGIEKVLTMLPTEEEKVRIQEAQNLNPDLPLGSAEQFLLTLASISQLEARLRLWAFKLDFEISEKEICEPLMDLKQGMEILKANKTFRVILSTLLSIGNFLNGHDAKGFQIEYLSKVPEVKDTVHKHSLLHHLCIIVMEKFPDSTDLYSEIGAVTRASRVDFEELSANIKQLEEDCKLSWNYLKIIAKHEGHTAMKVRMSDFLADCAERIIVLGVVHKRIMNRFQKFAYWLGVPTNRISTTRPNEIFKIVSEFSLEFRTTRDRVLQQIKKISREKSKTRLVNHSADSNDGVGRKMNSKEAKDDAKLKQLLGKETNYVENMNVPTWRRQRRDTKNILQETNQNDAEILETLLKTANQRSAGLNERRRSRILGASKDWPSRLTNRT